VIEKFSQSDACGPSSAAPTGAGAGANGRSCGWGGVGAWAGGLG
jgi:hypothetical protein